MTGTKLYHGRVKIESRQGSATAICCAPGSAYDAGIIYEIRRIHEVWTNGEFDITYTHDLSLKLIADLGSCAAGGIISEVDGRIDGFDYGTFESSDTYFEGDTVTESDILDFAKSEAATARAAASWSDVDVADVQVDTWLSAHTRSTVATSHGGSSIGTHSATQLEYRFTPVCTLLPCRISGTYANGGSFTDLDLDSGAQTAICEWRTSGSGSNNVSLKFHFQPFKN